MFIKLRTLKKKKSYSNKKNNKLDGVSALSPVFWRNAGTVSFWVSHNLFGKSTIEGGGYYVRLGDVGEFRDVTAVHTVHFWSDMAVFFFE